jgi:hypothetical protein
MLARSFGVLYVEGNATQLQEPVQPGTRAGVRPNQAAAGIVALVHTHATLLGEVGGSL